MQRDWANSFGLLMSQKLIWVLIRVPMRRGTRMNLIHSMGHGEDCLAGLNTRH